jgi:UDP-N-acetylmuramoylalanine--D-glutamate ligase
VAKNLSIEFINDSKATNADACEKALKTFIDKKIFWIVGGKAKTDGIESLQPYFPHIKKAYLIGDSKDRFAKDLCGKVNFEKVGTLEAAVCCAYNDAKSEENAVVLLSPACASFDQFKDFEHRGNEFIKFVKELLHDSNYIFTA